MNKYVIIATISLNANDEYYDEIENVVIKTVEAKSESEAFEKANITDKDIYSVCDLACGYDYHLIAYTCDQFFKKFNFIGGNK